MERLTVRRVIMCFVAVLAMALSSVVMWAQAPDKVRPGDSVSLILQKAYSWAYNGWYDDARGAYKEALKRCGKSQIEYRKMAYKGLIGVCFSEINRRGGGGDDEDYSEVLKYTDELVACDPKDNESLGRRARVLYKANKYEAALADIEELQKTATEEAQTRLHELESSCYMCMACGNKKVWPDVYDNFEVDKDLAEKCYQTAKKSIEKKNVTSNLYVNFVWGAIETGRWDIALQKLVEGIIMWTGESGYCAESRFSTLWKYKMGGHRAQLTELMLDYMGRRGYSEEAKRSIMKKWIEDCVSPGKNEDMATKTLKDIDNSYKEGMEYLTTNAPIFLSSVGDYEGSIEAYKHLIEAERKLAEENGEEISLDWMVSGMLYPMYLGGMYQQAIDSVNSLLSHCSKESYDYWVGTAHLYRAMLNLAQCKGNYEEIRQDILAARQGDFFSLFAKGWYFHETGDTCFNGMIRVGQYHPQQVSVAYAILGEREKAVKKMEELKVNAELFEEPMAANSFVFAMTYAILRGKGETLAYLRRCVDEVPECVDFFAMTSLSDLVKDTEEYRSIMAEAAARRKEMIVAVRKRLAEYNYLPELYEKVK